MAKILYAIAAEGMGHATRSKAVIDHLLQQGHKVHITTSSRAYEYLSKHYKGITRVSALHLAYQNNRVSLLRTFWMNMLRTPEHLRTISTTLRIIREFKPDLIINDFAFAANYLGIVLGIPVITLDNNRMVAKTKVDVPLKFWWDKLHTKIVNAMHAPMGYCHIITTFFFPPLKWHAKNVYLCFAPIRKEILKLKTSKKGYLLVYQTSTTNQKLLRDLQQIKTPCIVYGFGKRKKEKNLTFKPFEEQEFFNDLAGAEAVIMNGGFSLMAECLYLKKPILSIPIKGQFEQELNAIYLDRLGYGIMLKESSIGGINAFLNKADTFVKKLKCTTFDPKECLRLVDEKIEEILQLKHG